MSALRDGQPEPLEMATLAVALDPLVSAASYGTRAYQSVTDLPSGGTYTGNVSTDGDRVAVQVQLPEGEPSLGEECACTFAIRRPRAAGAMINC